MKIDQTNSQPPSHRDEGPLTWDAIFGLMTDLKVIARNLFSKEGNAGSVQTTGLVQTALRRQRRQGQEWDEVTWINRRYFFRAAHCAMRRALVDYARQRNRERIQQVGNFDTQFIAPLAKAGVLNLDSLIAQAAGNPELAEAVDCALHELEEHHPDSADAVQLYYFDDLDQQSIASILNVTERTVRNRLALAYPYLAEKLCRFFPGNLSHKP